MSSVARRLLVALAITVAALAPAPAAGALPILDPADAAELANKLAEATEEQSVCYGWIVNVQDDDAGFSVDQGSSLGPDRSPADAACTPAVIFVADLHYTSELSESADSATLRVESTLPLTITGSDLARFGVTGTSLLGDNDDVALLNAVSVLPALVAEAGLAPPVPVEATVGTIPAADGPTGAPAFSDRIRTYGALYFLAGLVFFAGVAWLVLGRFVLPWLHTASTVAASSPGRPPSRPDRTDP